MKMDWVSTLAILATVTSFICQLIGMEQCFNIIRKGTTGDVAPAPFVAFFVSSCVWLKYGLMMNNNSVILSSGFGTILQFVYISIYYVFSTKKHTMKWLIFFGFLMTISPFLYVSYWENEPARAMTNIGLYCCVLSIMVCASPLATVSDVIRQKCTNSISFPLCLVNFMCAVEWTLYGMAIKDQFVTLPNAFGGILGVIQFILFGVYGCRKEKVKPILMINT